MRETPADIVSLQALLDVSHAAAGAHLQSIITPERRLTAAQVADRLTGMCLLALATVTADGRPIVGPVDGIFYRGAFQFGTSPQALRWRHIRSRPQVSATHLPGEELAVTVHGRAAPLDIAASEHADFRDTLLEIYTPRYGADWVTFLDSGIVYARIEAAKMFTFQIDPASPDVPTD